MRSPQYLTLNPQQLVIRPPRSSSRGAGSPYRSNVAAKCKLGLPPGPKHSPVAKANMCCLVHIPKAATNLAPRSVSRCAEIVGS
jgi:hypothetical protein